MKIRSIRRFLASVVFVSTIPILAPAQEERDPQELMKRHFRDQAERFSRMFENDPERQKQFQKGLDEMLDALENGKLTPGEPHRFEWQWEGDASDLPNLDEWFDMRGPFGGSPFGRDFFRGGDFLEHFRDMFEAPGGPGGLGGFGLPDHELSEMVPGLSKNHPEELNKFRSVVAEARKSTISLLSGGRQVALGTIVSEDGYALTKGSELARRGDVFEAKLSDGRLVATHVVEHINDFDLALVKLEADGLTAASFVGTNLPVGSFLAAPGTDETPVAIGVLSVLPRTLSDKRKGYLGILIDTADEGVAIKEVTPGSAAELAGLQIGDVITSIDNDEVFSPAQLIRAISNRDPDATVTISFRRRGEERSASAQLRSRNDIPEESRFWLDRSRFDPTSRLGANVSRQRGGYPSAFQHDLPLRADQIGGPVVDLDGNIVGLNIARAGRVSTYALPARELIQILSDLDLENRPAQREAPDLRPLDTDPAIREELESAEQAIEQARRALEEAEERARAARQRLRENR